MEKSTRLQEYKPAISWTCLACGIQLPWFIAEGPSARCKPEKKVRSTVLELLLEESLRWHRRQRKESARR